MFRKEFFVKTKTTLKKSDKRNLFDRIAKSFYDVSQDEFRNLLSIKDDMQLIKIRTYSGVVVNVYSVKSSEGEVPIFFVVEENIFPTVYALWKYPNMVASMETNSYVYERLMNGADLMSPGVNKSPRCLNNFDLNQACSVRISKNLAAVAVGTTGMSSETLKSQHDASGKAVIIKHAYMDCLWAMGPKTKLPHIACQNEEREEEEAGDDDVDGLLEEVNEGKEGTKEEEDWVIVNQNGDEVKEDGDNETVVKKVGNNEVVVEEDGDNETVVEDTTCGREIDDKKAMDELMLQCFLCGLKKEGKRMELPILASDFYKNYMVAYCPESLRLDVKKSSYKKVTNFLREMSKDKVIGFADFNTQKICITSVDLEHEKIKYFKIPDILSKTRKIAGATAPDNTTTSAYAPPEINIIYSATSQVLPLLNCQKKQAFTKSEVNQLILNYARENNLQNRENITIDPILGSVILSRHEYMDLMHIKEVTDRVLNKMTIGYEFVFNGGREVRNGKPKLIEIDKRMKASNKMVTSAKNLKFFEIDVDQLASDLKRDLSCSVSVNKSEDVLSVQGDHLNAIKKHLKEKYNMPERHILVK